MLFNSETDLIHADRLQSPRLGTKDASRAPLTVLRVHRIFHSAFLSVVLSTSVTLSVGIGLSEDRQCSLQATETLPGSTESAKLATHPHLRSAMCYRIAMSPHVGLGQVDRDIQAAQRRVCEAPIRVLSGALGWLYVTKARAVTIKAFTSSPNSVRWRWKSPTEES